jgi:excinuclease UvrABC ATPase subunit
MNNLRNVSIKFPLGTLNRRKRESGSGKRTHHLINGTLYPTLAKIA